MSSERISRNLSSAALSGPGVTRACQQFSARAAAVASRIQRQARPACVLNLLHLTEQSEQHQSCPSRSAVQIGGPGDRRFARVANLEHAADLPYGHTPFGQWPPHGIRGGCDAGLAQWCFLISGNKHEAASCASLDAGPAKGRPVYARARASAREVPGGRGRYGVEMESCVSKTRSPLSTLPPRTLSSPRSSSARCVPMRSNVVRRCAATYVGNGPAVQ